MVRLFSLITLLSLFFSTPALSWDSTENRTWLQGALKGDLSDSVSLKLTEQLRYTDNTSFNYYRHTDLGIRWEFVDHWSVEPMYRHILARSKTSDWQSKPTWGLNIRNKTTISGLAIKTRLRFLYADLSEIDLRTDFRPLVVIEPAKGWTALKARPFLSNEFIYNFDQNLYYRNRLGGGLRITPFEVLDLKAFINQELTRDHDRNEWTERYNIVLAAQVSF